MHANSSLTEQYIANYTVHAGSYSLTSLLLTFQHSLFSYFLPTNLLPVPYGEYTSTIGSAVELQLELRRRMLFLSEVVANV